MRVNCAEIDDIAGALALGAALPEEVSAARAHLAACPHHHAPLRRLIETALALGEAVEEREPPAHLRARVLAPLGVAALAPAPPIASPSRQPATVLAPAIPGDAPIALPRRRRSRLLATAAVVAAVALLALAAAWSVHLQRDVDQLDNRVAEQQQVLDTVAAGGRVVAFTRAEGSAGAHGVVIQPVTGSPLLVLGGLHPPDGHVYQLWMIHDGQHADMGLIAPNDDGRYIATLPDLAGAQALTVTVETHHVAQPTAPPVLEAPLGSATI